jgi:hypothetical protein
VDNTITPNYMSLDFNTIKSDIENKLKTTDTFKDMNYEGSNISVIIQMMAYIGELNTFYMNKISKNLYFDTAELYENVHRLTNLTGYAPFGFRSSQTDVTIQIVQNTVGDEFSYGDVLSIPKFTKFKATIADEEVNFITVEDQMVTVDTAYTSNGNQDSIYTYEITSLVKEGSIYELNFYGSDIFNNKLSLPFFQFDHDDVSTTEQCAWLEVNNKNWQRVNHFFEDISGISNDYDIFKLDFDKYKKYSIIFSDNLNIPKETDEIKISLIQTVGEEGNVFANSIAKTTDSPNIVFNVTTDSWITFDNISVSNHRASSGGKSPETISEIKNMGKNYINTQFRCVTKLDYKNYIERYHGVQKAHAWGQQELQYQSDVRDYNKVYISVIPTSWNLYAIASEDVSWPVGNGNTATIVKPISYLNKFKKDLELFLEPHKMMSVYHSYQLPELVYFVFNISIEIYTNYMWGSVIQDVKDKLDYLFRTSNRNFGESIDYKDIEGDIKDNTIVSETNTFDSINGIKHLRIRDIFNNVIIYEPNDKQQFPQYSMFSYGSTSENKLRVINLGANQFPLIKAEQCKFSKEG